MQNPTSSYTAVPSGQFVSQGGYIQQTSMPNLTSSNPTGQIIPQGSYIQQSPIVNSGVRVEPLSSSTQVYASQPIFSQQSSGPVYIQDTGAVMSRSGAYTQAGSGGNGLGEATADTVIPGVEIVGEGVKTGVGSITGGLMTGVNSIKSGVLGGGETIANGLGVSTGGRVKGHGQFFRPEHSHQSHGVGTGLAEIGSGIVSLPVGLVGTGVNAVTKLGGAAIGTGLALGGTGIGVAADIIGNTAGVLGNTVRQIGHGLADLTHIHKKH